MLPVVICEPDSIVRTQWLDVLNEVASSEYPSLRLETIPGAEHELKRVLDTETGIILVILSVRGNSSGRIDDSIRMFGDVMGRNRDNYVMLCVHDSEHLGTVINQCMRPAGILLFPFQKELMRAGLKRILNDYTSLHITGDEPDYMMVNSGKRLMRIAYRDILFLEAQDKLLNINMGRHVITVRNTLNAVAGTLPSQFIRCHRSYIVNRSYIDQIDLPRMEIQLSTQERLPVSRSYKELLKEILKEEV